MPPYLRVMKYFYAVVEPGLGSFEFSHEVIVLSQESLDRVLGDIAALQYDSWGQLRVSDMKRYEFLAAWWTNVDDLDDLPDDFEPFVFSDVDVVVDGDFPDPLQRLQFNESFDLLSTFGRFFVTELHGSVLHLDADHLDDILEVLVAAGHEVVVAPELISQTLWSPGLGSIGKVVDV